MAQKYLQSDCFRINKTILYYAGLWPKGPSTRTYKLFFIAELFGLFFSYIALETVQVWKAWHDVISLVDITLILLTHVVMCPKVINFSYYMERIDRLTKTFDGK